MNSFEITRRQVERVKGTIESGDLDPEDARLMRACALTSLECAEERGEITREQREKLKKLLGVIDAVI